MWFLFEKVLRGTNLTKLRNDVLYCKEITREEYGYQWGLDKPEDCFHNISGCSAIIIILDTMVMKSLPSTGELTYIKPYGSLWIGSCGRIITMCLMNVFTT